MWSCRAQLPRFNLGHLWRAIPAPRLSVGSAEASITATLQVSLYLWPILPSYLPYRHIFQEHFPINLELQLSKSGSVGFQRTQSKACWCSCSRYQPRYTYAPLCHGGTFSKEAKVFFHWVVKFYWVFNKESKVLKCVCSLEEEFPVFWVLLLYNQQP